MISRRAGGLSSRTDSKQESGGRRVQSEDVRQLGRKREVCNTAKQTEALLALSCGNRAEVDDMVKTAVAAGGQHAMDPQDHGFMYAWSFYDLDGHHWEVLWMDESAIGNT